MLNPASGSSSLRRSVAVAIVAASVVGTEIVSYQTLTFVNDHFTAMAAVASALMGVSVGGLLAFVASPEDRYDRITLALFPLVVVGGLPAIARLTVWPILLTALLTLPYVLASFYVARSFEKLGAGRAYAADLIGASVGAILAAVAVPGLREEGTFLLLGLLAALALPVHVGALRFGAPALLPALGLLAHLAFDPFNLMRTATADPSWGKLFDKSGFELLYSRGSLIERIDIVKFDSRKNSWASVYNGRVVDSISADRAKIGRLDNRMPTLLKAGTNPDTLLVGPSGQGLCKPVQALGTGHISAVEINGAIAGLMSREMYKRSGKAYAGMELTVGDVRSFLAATDRRYDFITLLNTHRIWSIGHQGPPEYVHTLEAMRDYLGHLEGDGFVLFEERDINDRANLGIRRMIQTMKAALIERGMDPERHFAIWEVYHKCTEARAALNPPECPRSELFTFVMVKQTPITTAEQDHLLEWANIVAARPPEPYWRGILWRYLPDHPTDSQWTDVVRADDLYDLPGADPALHELGVVTDDRPFPYDVFRERTEVWAMVRSVGVLALLMVLLPALALVGRPPRHAPLSAALLAVQAAALGVGYLLVEIVLVQELAFFLWSPAIALTVVLSGMLLASGLGSAWSERIGRRGAMLALIAAAGGAVLASVGLDQVVSSLMGLSFAFRVLVALLLIGPLAFAMGIPFAWSLGRARAGLGPRYGALLFAVNGALSAMATPAALLLSMQYGFDATMLAGAGAYLLAAALLIGVRLPEAP